MANGLEGVLGGFAGILGGAMGVPVNLAINKIVELKKNKKSNPKEVTLENIFDTLKEKISKYSESVEINTLEVAKIEEEIRSLKAKIDELNSSTEGKSKIEKMKIILNITSIESEITLKEVDLEEKKKAEKDYDNRIQSSNKKIEDTKKELEIFIKDTEETLEKTVKNFSKKEEINNFKLTTLQEQGLNKLGLTVSDLSGIKLTNTELWLLEKLSNYSDEGVKNFNIVGLNNISMGINIRKSDDLKLYLKKFINIKNNKIAKEKLIEGTDLEEVKSYYDNIMKVEFLNLENIEKEEVRITGEEKKKLEIKKEAIENKINTVNEMVDEMIKEVIKEELKKREIVIPAFVPVTKYFNAPNEEE